MAMLFETLTQKRLAALERGQQEILLALSIIHKNIDAMGKQQGFKFKHEKNPRRVEVGKRSWAARKAREAEAAKANGVLGLVDGPQEG